MILSQDHSDARYQIQSISPGKICINNEMYTSSLIISPNQLMTPWHPTSIETLTDADLLLFLDLNPEIILLGTGEKSIIPKTQQLACLLEKQFHIECMNTAAACRTYTVLISEGRNVAAGLIL